MTSLCSAVSRSEAVQTVGVGRPIPVSSQDTHTASWVGPVSGGVSMCTRIGVPKKKRGGGVLPSIFFIKKN